MLLHNNMRLRFTKAIKPLDVAFLKLSMIFFGLSLASYFKTLTEINASIYFCLSLLLAIKPAVFYLRK